MLRYNAARSGNFGEDQKALNPNLNREGVNLESGALDRSAILTFHIIYCTIANINVHINISSKEMFTSWKNVEL